MNTRFDQGVDSTALAVPFREKSSDAPLEILSFALDALKSGMPAALIFLTEIRGGAARALGAQMAVRADGGFCGFVSGGCVEAAVAAEALEALELGTDKELMLGAGSPYFDIVLPCGGGLTLTIHCLKDGTALSEIVRGLMARRRVALRYVPASSSLVLDAQASETGWSHAGFTMAYRPAPLIFVSGQSIETETLSRIAQSASYEVRQLDPANAPKPEDFDPDSALVLLHHDIEREVGPLIAALAGAPFYIGALGGVRTHARRVAKLEELGCSKASIERIKAPIGIFSKARDAVSLSLSILADIAALRR
ncbi:XdhC family protein [Rhizobium sp. Rhizsp42]|uniref:XdhC family protein n=1 Tax=Rhizobium sp. Rhizsp42 TaxID=3243034 RepID=UPI0039AF99FC